MNPFQDGLFGEMSKIAQGYPKPVQKPQPKTKYDPHPINIEKRTSSAIGKTLDLSRRGGATIRRVKTTYKYPVPIKKTFKDGSKKYKATKFSKRHVYGGPSVPGHPMPVVRSGLHHPHDTDSPETVSIPRGKYRRLRRDGSSITTSSHQKGRTATIKREYTHPNSKHAG